MRRNRPGAFYFGASDTPDWTSPHNDALWRDGTKTLFDPCPAGWRVPQNGTDERSLWAAFTVENSTWNGDETFSATNGRRYGQNIYGGSSWYPADGARQEATSLLTWGGELGFIWSATATERAAFDLFCSYLDIIYANAGAARAAGLPVRCVRE